MHDATKLQFVRKEQPLLAWNFEIVLQLVEKLMEEFVGNSNEIDSMMRLPIIIYTNKSYLSAMSLHFKSSIQLLFLFHVHLQFNLKIWWATMMCVLWTWSRLHQNSLYLTLCSSRGTLLRLGCDSYSCLLLGNVHLQVWAALPSTQSPLWHAHPLHARYDKNAISQRLTRQMFMIISFLSPVFLPVFHMSHMYHSMRIS